MGIFWVQFFISLKKWQKWNKNGQNHTIFARFLVGGGGFEPPKSETSDLQSDAFGHSAIRPYYIKPASAGILLDGAGDWNRTHNLLITNQLLCQLSYTSAPAEGGALGWNRTADIWIFSPPLYRLSYQGDKNAFRRYKKFGDPKRARTVDLQRDRLAL